MVVRRQHIDVQVHTQADAGAVYALLRDGASWPTWSPIDSFELERTGAQETEGIGAIRIYVRGRVRGRDEIAELVLDRRFGYRHLSGMPVSDYRGEVDLQPDDRGTEIRWRTSFLPRRPGTGPLLRWGIERFIRKCARGLAAHAATRSAPHR